MRKELAQDQKGMEKEEVQAREQRVSDITKAMSEHLIPMLQAIDAGPSAGKTFEQAYLSEVLERILKCEAAINSQIDKSVNRLVRSKEYKWMYGPHAPVLPKVDSSDTVAELEDLHQRLLRVAPNPKKQTDWACTSSVHGRPKNARPNHSSALPRF